MYNYKHKFPLGDLNMKNKIASIMVLFIAIFLFSIKSNSDNLISDPNLRELIAENLNVKESEIDIDRLSLLESIEIYSERNIKSLQGLEYAKNLESLVICVSEDDILDESSIIYDYSPISKLDKLKRLTINGYPVFDISFLSELTALRSLELIDINPNNFIFDPDLINDDQAIFIDDLSPISDLNNLLLLNISNNGIEDLSPIAGLYKLEYLNISGNELISDISVVNSLFNLIEFYGDGCRVEVIPPLDNLKRLEKFHLSNSKLADLTFLKNLNGLKELKLNNNFIEDLAPLLNMNSLEYLSVSNNYVSDLRPLSNLASLNELYLDHNKISEVIPLAFLQNLEVLNLNNNRIRYVEPLDYLEKLSFLSIQNNPLSLLHNSNVHVISQFESNCARFFYMPIEDHHIPTLHYFR